MFSKSQKEEIVRYWQEGAQEALKTMNTLYSGKRYADCLFFGHLTLEKILKASVSRETGAHAPYTHNLTHLATLSNIEFDQGQYDIIAKVNEFNMQARYPDAKLSFYRQCTKGYTDECYQPITDLYKYICRKIK